MRKMTLLVAALAFSSVAGGIITSSAAPQKCTPSGASNATKDRTASDPFGSCESTSGQVKCGRDGATALPGNLGYVIVNQDKGAQVCSEDAQAFPVAGRVSVYKHPGGNKVSVAADGGDSKNQGGAAAYDRLDVDADNQEACFWRGASGTWYQRNGQPTNPGTATGENKTCTP